MMTPKRLLFLALLAVTAFEIVGASEVVSAAPTPQCDSTPQVPDGHIFLVRTNSDPHMCLDPVAGGTYQMQLNTCSNLGPQQFQFQKQADSCYRIRAYGADDPRRVLTAGNEDHGEHTAIVFKDIPNDDPINRYEQEWDVHFQVAGTTPQMGPFKIVILRGVQVGGCMAKGDDKPGANVILAPCNGLNDQEWVLENEHTREAVSDSTHPLLDGPHVVGAKAVVAALPNGQTVVPGVYQIQSGIPYKGSQGMCWDLNLNFPAGAMIIQNPCSNHPTQYFRVNNDMDANGFRTISSTFSEPNFRYVEPGNCQAGCVGTTVMLAENTPKQKAGIPSIQPFQPTRYRFNDIQDCPGCRYIVIGADGQYCVDRPSQHMDEGDYIQPYKCDDKQNQRWIMLGPVPNATPLEVPAGSGLQDPVPSIAEMCANPAVSAQFKARFCGK